VGPLAKNNRPSGKKRFGNVKIPQSEEFLTAVVQYLFNTDKYINLKTLDNIDFYQSLIEDDEGSAFEEILKRVIRIIIPLRMEGLSNYKLLKSELYSHNFDEALKEKLHKIVDDYVMDKQEIRYINTKIKDIVDYHHIFDFLDETTELGEELYTGEYDSITSIVANVRKCVERFESTVNDRVDDTHVIVNMTSKEGEDFIRDAVTEAKDDSGCFKTGVIAWNNSLGGGHYNGKLYIYGAPPKNYKSVCAMNIVAHAREFNTYRCDETGMVPTILFCFNENSIRETIERMYIAETGQNFTEAKTMPIDNILNIFKERLGFGADDDSDDKIRVHFWKAPDETVDFKDIRIRINNLYDEGFKVVMVVDDYLGTKKKPAHILEERKKYGQLARDAKTLADDLDIPVITFHQLSRASEEAMAEAVKNGTDPVLALTSPMMSESHDIKMKVDALTVICAHMAEGRSSIQFKDLGNRYVKQDTSGRSYFIDHPIDNLKIIPDIHRGIISRLTTRKAANLNQMPGYGGGTPPPPPGTAQPTPMPGAQSQAPSF
jgi:replicative DNA helicase